jgi:hypothetical protein
VVIGVQQHIDGAAAGEPLVADAAMGRIGDLFDPAHRIALVVGLAPGAVVEINRVEQQVIDLLEGTVRIRGSAGFRESGKGKQPETQQCQNGKSLQAGHG